MCILALALHAHPDYQFILASNRDEFHQRPTEYAHPWPDIPNLYAGRDKQGKGTWLGITEQGQFSILTNHRNPKLIQEHYPTRGKLVLDALTKTLDADKWRVYIKKEKYNPFNILFGNLQHALYSYDNIHKEVKELPKGIHVLSNAFLNTSWPKTDALKEAFTQTIQKPLIGENLNEVLHENLIKIMQNETKFKENLPNTYISKDLEYFLSSIFIKGEQYGTRTTSIITVDYNHQVLYTEISYNEKKEKVHRIQHAFNILPN